MNNDIVNKIKSSFGFEQAYKTTNKNRIRTLGITLFNKINDFLLGVSIRI
jgi:hypothetical protein